MKMNILDYIQKDHKALKEVLSRIEKTEEKNAGARKEYFADLKDVLLPHAKSEEAVLYRTLEKNKESKAAVLEGFEEHSLADYLLNQLSELDVTSAHWTAKFAVLKEGLEHHIKEEEDVIFAEAKKHLSSEELEEMGLRMDSMKTDIKLNLKNKDTYKK